MTWNQVKFDIDLNRGFGSLLFFLTPQPRGLDPREHLHTERESPNTWEEVVHACGKESAHALEEVTPHTWKRNPVSVRRKANQVIHPRTDR